MSDPLTDAINTNATSPNSVASDGQSVTSQNLEGQIAAKKFLDANAFLQGLGSLSPGQSPFPHIRVRVPGARGGCDDDY